MTAPAGYLLDTNVVSETRKARPNPGVIAFLQGVDAASLFVSVLTIGELWKGVRAKSRLDQQAGLQLAQWVEGIEQRFTDRLLPIDTAIAQRWGEVAAVSGGPVIDTLLAATAMVHGLVLVSRNVRDLRPTGVRLVNPWDSPAP